MNSESVYRYPIAAEAVPEQRAAFVRRTYTHLAGAILLFIAIEALLFQTGAPEMMMGLLAQSSYSWLIVMGAFMGVSYLADRWATSNTSAGMQYAGLGLFVAAEAIIFVPLLYMAAILAGPEVITGAALTTLLLFAGLTFTVFTTGKDFTFLGGALKIGAFVAMGAIIASILFGFTLGLLFSSVMVLFAAGAILYNTSAVMNRFHTTQHVAAALTLFAYVALLFWYILRIAMSLTRRD